MASHILCCWCKEHLVVFVTMQMVIHYLSLFADGLITPGVQGVYRLCLLFLTDFPGDSLQLGDRVGRPTPVG